MLFFMLAASLLINGLPVFATGNLENDTFVYYEIEEEDELQDREEKGSFSSVFELDSAMKNGTLAQYFKEQNTKEQLGDLIYIPNSWPGEVERVKRQADGMELHFKNGLRYHFSLGRTAQSDAGKDMLDNAKSYNEIYHTKLINGYLVHLNDTWSDYYNCIWEQDGLVFFLLAPQSMGIETAFSYCDMRKSDIETAVEQEGLHKAGTVVGKNVSLWESNSTKSKN